MTTTAHLWAIGYDDMERAEQVRHEIMRLEKKRCLILLDTAVVVRYPDGSTTLDGGPFIDASDPRDHTLTSFLVGLALAVPPLTGAAVRPFLKCAGAVPCGLGIDDGFISEVESLIKAGTSALFVLDQVGDMDAILQGIRGLGGTVLKTNVDIERAKLIQDTLAAATATKIESGNK